MNPPNRTQEPIGSFAVNPAVRIGHVHLRHLNPLARNLGEIMSRYKKVLVPEMNLGQLLFILRAKYLVPAEGYNKVQGQPFKQSEIEAKIEEVLETR